MINVFGYELSCEVSDLTKVVLHSLRNKGCVYIQMDDGPECAQMYTDLTSIEDEMGYFKIFREGNRVYVFEEERFEIEA